MLISVIDDDSSAQCLLQAALEQAGHQVQLFSDGISFLSQGVQADVGMLIMEWQLPGMQGPEVVQAVRQMYGSDLPLLLASQRCQEIDVVQALQAGADDFISKPLQLPVFMARVQALIRRTSPITAKQALQFGPYCFDADGRHVSVASQRIALTPREHAIALHLFERPGQLVTRQQLLTLFWPQDTPSSMASLDTHMFRIRTKLQLNNSTEQPSTHHVSLTTVYNAGYRLQLFYNE